MIILNLVLSPRQKLDDVTRLSLKTDVIEKRNRNRNSDSLATSLKNSVSSITATGAARGIGTVLGPTRFFTPSGGLGIPVGLAMKTGATIERQHQPSASFLS